MTKEGIHVDSIVTSAVVIDGAHAGAPFGMPFVDARLCTDALSSTPHCERDGRCGSDTGSDTGSVACSLSRLDWTVCRLGAIGSAPVL